MFVDLNPDTEKIIYSHFTCATGKNEFGTCSNLDFTFLFFYVQQQNDVDVVELEPYRHREY